MKRIHLSSNNYLNDNVCYIPWMAADYPLKPSGLWYAIGYQWYELCVKNKAEEYTGYKYSFELKIDMEKVCVLNDVESTMNFHRRYGYRREGNYTAIDWEKVKVEYSGIEVINYERVNFDCSFRAVIWLSHWALDSGCIWDLSAIDLKGVQPKPIL